MSSFSSSPFFAPLLESLSLPPQLPPIATAALAEQLCYLQCHFCDTVLAVSVPASSLFKTVTVRCGHCGALLAVNTTGLLIPCTATATTTNATITTTTATPPAAQSTSTRHGQSHFGHALILDEVSSANPIPSLLHALDQQSFTTPTVVATAKRAKEPSPRTSPAFDRPPEKRQRVPSAYNRFIKDEIRRIKAGNPEISHREAFSAAAKNWGHFLHIHFGLMPDYQSLKKTSFIPQDHQRKDGIYTAVATNMRVAPF